jgi:hypothetical protein
MAFINRPASAKHLFADIEVILNVFDSAVVRQRLDELNDGLLERAHRFVPQSKNTQTCPHFIIVQSAK